LYIRYTTFFFLNIELFISVFDFESSREILCWWGGLQETKE